MGEAAIEAEYAGWADGAGEDRDASRGLPTEAAMAATTISRPATRIVVIRRGGVRDGSLWVMRPVNAAECCRSV